MSLAGRIRHAVNKVPRSGPDSRESWLMAALCGMLLLLCFSTVGVSGVFFYGILETFGSTREEAAWPVTLNGALLLLGGPIMGFLSERYSCRKVLLGCSIISGLAVSLCFFARTLACVTLLFGIVHGTTLSGLYVNANVLVAQHFERRRVTATSLAYTTGGFYAVAFSSLAELLRSTYGTRGAFLLYGAILMNAVPLSIMLRSPPAKLVPSCQRKTSKDFARSGKDEAESLDVESDDVACGTRLSVVVVEARPLNDKVARVSEEVKCAVRPFLTYAFTVNTLSFSVISGAVFLFVMLSTDLSTDRGASTVDATRLLQVFCVTDITVRPLTGLAIDSKFISLESVMTLGFLLQGAAFELLAWCGSFRVMLLASALMGLTCGSRIPLHAPSLARDFGVENLPLLMGGSSLCMGVVSLLRPPFVGRAADAPWPHFRTPMIVFETLNNASVGTEGMLMQPCRSGKSSG
ncbi:hypothetical protein HPB50_025205 [Hyalomma asiaticum]|uniref:Uncharacterized protein n=1 Tax=Hyalomma asiaticum TaxID=266040 RepID=A0ACB7S6E8_HYAAI|nr:hypothetical protein HPB50_025205 [Hyalomma asiaticum]